MWRSIKYRFSVVGGVGRYPCQTPPAKALLSVGWQGELWGWLLGSPKQQILVLER